MVGSYLLFNKENKMGMTVLGGSSKTNEEIIIFIFYEEISIPSFIKIYAIQLTSNLTCLTFLTVGNILQSANLY